MIPEIYDWTTHDWSAMGDLEGIIVRATSWESGQAIMPTLVDDWTQARRRGVPIRLMFQRLVSWIPWKQQADALLAAVAAVGGLLGDEGVELDLEATQNSMVSVYEATKWLGYVESKGIRTGTYANYSERFSGGELVRTHPIVTSRPFRLAYWNDATYPPEEPYWWARQYNCTNPAPGFSTAVCKNTVLQRDVWLPSGMILPQDYEPELILARSYRTTYRYFPNQFWIVWHDTEGSEGVTSAEDGAYVNQRRTDEVSCHQFVDPDSVVQSVPDEWVSFSAGSPANDFGKQLEICGKVSQSPDEWLVPDQLLWNVAWCTARWCKKFDIPVRFLTADDLCDDFYQRGITSHWEITKAEQGKGTAGNPRPSALRDFKLANNLTLNTHTDPGSNFPYELVLARTQEILDSWDPINPQEEVGDMAVLLVNSEVYPQFQAAADLGYVPPAGGWPVGWVWFLLMPEGGKRWLYGEEYQAWYDSKPVIVQRTTGQLQAIPDYVKPATKADVQVTVNPTPVTVTAPPVAITDTDKAAIAAKTRDEFTTRPLNGKMS